MALYRYTFILFIGWALFSPASVMGQLQCGFDLMISSEDGAWIDQGLASEIQDVPESAQVTLPIVFHIIQDGTQGSLNDADVISLFDYLNDAFANRGFYDPSTGVDTEISFCMAKQDENGLPTSGITRTNSILTTITAETQDADLKNVIHWDPLCYINVYIIFEINSAALGPGVQGYANFPSAHGSPTDGIVIETAFADGSPVSAAVLIHEMGHFLGLYHTFQGGCPNADCNVQGDRICDTPPDNSTAPADCANPINSCNTDAQSGLPADVPDMVTNYLDYGYLDCRNDFTQGQADRMQMAINTQRISMLSCKSCEDPCPNPITATIGFDSLNASINAPFRFWAENPPLGAIFEWSENGVVFNTSDTVNTTMQMEGKRVVVLKVTAYDIRCVSYDTICINISCPVTITHNTRDTACLEPGSLLVFIGNVTNNTDPLEWYLNGVLDQTGATFQWVVPTTGVFELQLVARNGDCEVETITYFLFVNCKEICDNEIDDDGDGLVDGYDDDCCDTINQFFFDPCYDNCPYEIKDAFTSIQRKYTTSGFEWHEAGTPLVGDVDNDGEVEIVGLKTEYINNGQQKVSKNYYVLDGKTGNLEIEFDPGGMWRSFSQQLAIADTDRDGYAEIYSFGRNLSRFDINPGGGITPRWSAGGGAFAQPTITDVDEDGLAEIVVDNGIFDAATGRTLIGINTSINDGGITWVASKTGSAVVDVLPNNFCPNCDGKELVVGNQVYSIFIDRAGFSRLNLEVQLPTGDDGYTSIADMDLDGDLDAVVLYTVPLPDFMSERHVLVWDIQTPTQLAPEFVWNNRFDRIAQAALGDIDGDDIPDIVIADYSTLRGISMNGGTWSTLFNLPNNDGSGMAGPSLFDFDADGKMEVISRDQTTLRIIDDTGRVLYSDACESGTGWETPVVADIDGDREAELLCSCAGQLQVYEPNPGTWALTRPVWNQQIYYTVNINDDLTLPLQEQQQHLPGMFNEVNIYMAQYGTKEYQASDLEPFVLDKLCEGDNVRYKLEICNNGPATFNDTLRITGYQDDPRALNTTILYSKDTLFPIIYPDSCYEIDIVFDRGITNIFLVINDDGSLLTPFTVQDDFPSTGINECDFFNNVLALSGFAVLPGPDLGPDTTMCDFGTFIVDAGPGYASYLWPDQTEDQTYTIWGPGKHWVEVQDSCGKIYTDTIEIVIDPATVIDLGPDRTLCNGDSLLLQINAFQNIQWTPAEAIDCPNCPNVVIKSDSTITITVIGETEAGCFSFDSLQITVGEGYFERDSILICEDDSIMLNGVFYRPGEVSSDTLGSGGECDSILQSFIYAIPVPLELGPNFSACSGDSIFFDLTQFDSVAWNPNSGLMCLDCPLQEVELTQSNIFEVTVFDENGCQKTDQLVVTVDDTIRTADTVFLCEGDSVFRWNNWYSTPGTYSEVISSQESCDTFATLDLRTDTFSYTPLMDQNICAGDTIILSVVASGGQSILWSGGTTSDLSCPTCFTTEVHPQNDLTLIVNIISELGCIYTDSVELIVDESIVLTDTARICPEGDSVFFLGIWRKEAGVYEGRIPGPGCDTLSRLTVVEEGAGVYSLPDTIEVERGMLQNIVITGDQSSVTNFNWISNMILSCTACPSPQVDGLSEGEVWVELTLDNGCVITLVTYIKIKEIVGNVFVPNIFSPNGDNVNDRLNIFSNDENALIENMRIFDRWGELVYESGSVLVKDFQGWDGQLNGKQMNPGVFVMALTGTFSSGETFGLTSSFTLLY